MNMPRFTGEASLYKTSLHYKSARHAIDLSSQISSMVHAAAIWVGNNEGKSVNCDTCVGGECAGLGCTGKPGEIDRLIKELIDRVVDRGDGGGGGDPINKTCKILDGAPVCFQLNPFTNCCTTTYEKRCKLCDSCQEYTEEKSSGTQCYSTIFVSTKDLELTRG